MSIPQTGKKSEKSVKLSPDELTSLDEQRQAANSDTAFATLFKIDRVTLIRIVTVGSGSEANVKKIRRKLNALKQLA
jgi:hypothetical protein